MSHRSRRLTTAGHVLVALAIFIASWFLRYNDPEGSYGGLSDDHFFYVAPGWQMLFGDLPDRDFAELGAPLTVAISGWLQMFVDRSIGPEYTLSVTVLALGAALTYLVATRASGSMLLGLLAAVIEIALRPRLYNYPKIIVYAVAIPVLWAWASGPRTRRTWLVAFITALAFLMRHDHGVYIGVAFGVLLFTVPELSWRERILHGTTFTLAALLFVMPYFAYLQVNGGIARHFTVALAWSQRDYERAPAVLPTLELRPLFDQAPGDEPPWWERGPWFTLSSYSTWWLFWLVNLLPAIALLLLAIRPSTGPPRWTNERAKVLALAVLAVVVNLRFIRGNLAGRLPDVVVPNVILGAWALSIVARIVWSGLLTWRGRSVAPGLLARGTMALAAIVVVALTAGGLVRQTAELLDNGWFTRGLDAALNRSGRVTDSISEERPFSDRNTTGPLALAHYVDACTQPTDRVLMTHFLPQVLALARRAFAGGHVDVRGGFFQTTAEQELIVERLQQHSVPIIIGPVMSELPGWKESRPIVGAYVSRTYAEAGEYDFGGVAFTLLAHNDSRSVRTYQPYGLPCFR